MAFTTIELAAGLDPQQRRAARDAAPLAVAARKPYLDLLAQAGLVEADRRDVSGEYEQVAAASLAEYQEHREALIEAAGEEFVSDRIQTWTAALRVIRTGWLQRYLYWTRRP